MLNDQMQAQLDGIRARLKAVETGRPRTRARTLASAVALVALTATATRYVVAATPSPTPQTVPYRGTLKQNGVAVPNGKKQMAFSFYDQAIGGSQIWGPETKNVTVADGVFSVMLGDSVTL